MDIFKEVISGQIAHLIFTLLLGLSLGWLERKNPARNIKEYKDHLVEVYALVLLFAVALALGIFIRHVQLNHTLINLHAYVANIPWYILVPITSLIADFGNYCAHRLLHTKSFWQFHRWHHSPEYLFWFSGFRGSALHIFFMALTSMIILTLTGPNPWVIGTIVIQGLSAQMLGHINLNIDHSFLEKILVLPQYHRIHHGVDRKLNDSNFSFCWTIWDKIFKTYTSPKDVPANFPLGLNPSDKKSLFKLILGKN